MWPRFAAEVDKFITLWFLGFDRVTQKGVCVPHSLNQTVVKVKKFQKLKVTES